MLTISLALTILYATSLHYVPYKITSLQGVSCSFNITMAKCSHDISLLNALTCSGPYRCRCPDCGAVLVRRHTRTHALIEFLFSAMGLPILVLFVLSIMWLPWVILGTAVLLAGLYAWDTSVNPLHIETAEEKNSDRKSNLYALVILGIILSSVVVYLINET